MRQLIACIGLTVLLCSCGKEKTCTCVTNEYIDGKLEETSTIKHTSTGYSANIWCSAFETTTETDNYKIETICELD